MLKKKMMKRTNIGRYKQIETFREEINNSLKKIQENIHKQVKELNKSFKEMHERKNR